MRKVTLNGVEYPYIFGMGALLIYESLMGESFSDASLGKLTATPTIAIHYACLCTGGPEFSLSFAEFSRTLSDRKVVEDLRIALEEELMRWNSVNTADAGDKESASDDTQGKKK